MLAKLHFKWFCCNSFAVACLRLTYKIECNMWSMTIVSVCNCTMKIILLVLLLWEILLFVLTEKAACYEIPSPFVHGNPPKGTMEEFRPFHGKMGGRQHWPTAKENIDTVQYSCVGKNTAVLEKIKPTQRFTEVLVELCENKMSWKGIKDISQG